MTSKLSGCSTGEDAIAAPYDTVGHSIQRSQPSRAKDIILTRKDRYRWATTAVRGRSRGGPTRANVDGYPSAL